MGRERWIIAAALAAGLGAVGQDVAPSTGPEPVEREGIENLYRLSPRLYSGAQPEGNAAFRALAELGVETIITVDGAEPDLEAAARYGLRYIHLPIGYDGVPRNRAVELVKAVEGLEGPVYVHCHHGKHRGPTAAAICAMAVEGWDRQAAIDWLNLAGTSPDYAGLFATVERFEPPTPEELAGAPEVDDLPERAELPDLVDAMVEVDGRWDLMKAIARSGFVGPEDHPDLDPPHEATMLAEQFRELRRLDEAKDRGADFLGRLEAAERHAIDLRDALRDLADGATPERRAAASAAFEAAGRDCTSCHEQFRN